MNLEDLKSPFLTLNFQEKLRLVREMRERRITGGDLVVGRTVEVLTKGKTREEIQELLNKLKEKS